MAQSEPMNDEFIMSRILFEPIQKVRFQIRTSFTSLSAEQGPNMARCVTMRCLDP